MWSLDADGSDIAVHIGGRRIAYRVGAPGAHIAQNSLAVIAALDALGADVEKAVPALAAMRAAKGRGERREIAVPGGSILLIDESYNANPASMRSALAAMAAVPRTRYSRRIAVLGDMLELGENSGALHAALNDPVDAAEVDLVFACGRDMQRLFEALPAAAPRGVGAAVGGDCRGAGAIGARGRRGDGQRIARLTHGAAGRLADCQGRTTTCASPRLTWAQVANTRQTPFGELDAV